MGSEMGKIKACFIEAGKSIELVEFMVVYVLKRILLIVGSIEMDGL